jgi:hypothetical protein
MILNEGGNVFKDKQGQSLTGRINRVDIGPTVNFLERITGLDLANNMIGSTGYKESSGDLDLAVDANLISKDALIEVLVKYCEANNFPQPCIKKTGNSVHLLTPINGDPKNGYVQTDFMFLHDMDYSKWIYGHMPDVSQYKGVDRTVLFNSIGKAVRQLPDGTPTPEGVKIDVNTGLKDRQTNELITANPNEIAQVLLGPSANARDLDSVESAVGALRNDPHRAEKLKDFAGYLEKSQRQMPQLEASAHPTEWFRHLSNKLK